MVPVAFEGRVGDMSLGKSRRERLDGETSDDGSARDAES
jgi:hypothetical protein